MCILPTRKEFDSCLFQFYNESNNCSSEITKWSWESTNTIIKQSFITRKSTMLVPTKPSMTRNFEMNDLVEETEDPTSVSGVVSAETIDLEHHIVYSTTYQVPVLYLRASYSNGTPLSHEEVYEYIVPESYQHVALSQNQHPILNIPCWYIHPCDTRVLMSTLKFDQVDYIKSWLSVQGPLAKCQISMDMFII